MTTAEPAQRCSERLSSRHLPKQSLVPLDARWSTLYRQYAKLSARVYQFLSYILQAQFINMYVEHIGPVGQWYVAVSGSEQSRSSSAPCCQICHILNAQCAMRDASGEWGGRGRAIKSESVAKVANRNS
jgi:hypothetical protein